MGIILYLLSKGWVQYIVKILFGIMLFTLLLVFVVDKATIKEDELIRSKNTLYVTEINLETYELALEISEKAREVRNVEIKPAFPGLPVYLNEPLKDNVQVFKKQYEVVDTGTRFFRAWHPTINMNNKLTREQFTKGLTGHIDKKLIESFNSNSDPSKIPVYLLYSDKSPIEKYKGKLEDALLELQSRNINGPLLIAQAWAESGSKKTPGTMYVPWNLTGYGTLDSTSGTYINRKALYPFALNPEVTEIVTGVKYDPNDPYMPQKIYAACNAENKHFEDFWKDLVKKAGGNENSIYTRQLKAGMFEELLKERGYSYSLSEVPKDILAPIYHTIPHYMPVRPDTLEVYTGTYADYLKEVGVLIANAKGAYAGFPYDPAKKFSKDDERLNWESNVDSGYLEKTRQNSQLMISLRGTYLAHDYHHVGSTSWYAYYKDTDRNVSGAIYAHRYSTQTLELYDQFMSNALGSSSQEYMSKLYEEGKK